MIGKKIRGGRLPDDRLLGQRWESGCVEGMPQIYPFPETHRQCDYSLDGRSQSSQGLNLSKRLSVSYLLSSSTQTESSEEGFKMKRVGSFKGPYYN